MNDKNGNDSEPMEGQRAKAIHRAQGSTRAERYLQNLGEHTFLSLWSYAGIYRDQGRISRSSAGTTAGIDTGTSVPPTRVGDGKELCDLLVVFQDHLIIFSDKDCDFPDTGNLDLDWNRWYRRAVQSGAQQLWGAERWIRKYPGTLFLDRACSQPFPLNLPHPDKVSVHRIVVAHGAAERCHWELGGSGSLMIKPDIVGSQHLLPMNQGGMPFAIGQIDPAKGYVHVLDDTSLDIVMGTLDTVADFVAYLQKKEAFIRSGRLLGATGEEDLLAFYLRDINDVNEHDFVVGPSVKAVAITEGVWERFQRSPERKAQIHANQASYFWDMMIEEFTKHALAGTSHFTTDPSLQAHDRVLGFLAREPRTRRRMLAEIFLDMMRTTPPGTRRTRVIIPSSPGEPHYVFLTLPPLQNIPYEAYRIARRNLLEACCMAAKDHFPDATDLVGVATEPFPFEEASQDLLYYDASNWTDKLQREAQKVRKEFGLLVNLDKFEAKVQDYPDVTDDKIILRDAAPEYPSQRLGPNPRNKPCPCGSGRKYKKCCGR